MYHPKRSCNDVYYDTFEYYPKRALADREQTLIDTAAAINYGSLDHGFAYFVTRCDNGNPCANDIHH